MCGCVRGNCGDNGSVGNGEAKSTIMRKGKGKRRQDGEMENKEDGRKMRQQRSRKETRERDCIECKEDEMEIKREFTEDSTYRVHKCKINGIEMKRNIEDRTERSFKCDCKVRTRAEKETSGERKQNATSNKLECISVEKHNKNTLLPPVLRLFFTCCQSLRFVSSHTSRLFLIVVVLLLYARSCQCYQFKTGPCKSVASQVDGFSLSRVSAVIFSEANVGFLYDKIT